ncbi:hypothetical protein QTP86_000930 [Hemibagrus guttatus]|nr:hypothetical protein QTP86_000930 [Hemibagrus guttatus]
MLRFSLGVTRLDRIRNEYIRGTAHVGRLGDKVREARLRWFGHVQRRENGLGYKKIAKTLKLSCSTVAKTIQRFNRTGSTQNRPRHGQPK